MLSMMRCAKSLSLSRMKSSTEVSTAEPSMLIISAAVFAPPIAVFFTLSPPASTLPITSFRSRSAIGWIPSSVATRTSTSLRWRSANSLSTSLA